MANFSIKKLPIKIDSFLNKLFSCQVFCIVKKYMTIMLSLAGVGGFSVFPVLGWIYR